MSHITTVLLGNRRGSDGICAFSREILFRTAGQWVADALPKDLCKSAFYFAEEGEFVPEGMEFIAAQVETRYQALRQESRIFDKEHVLIIAAPMPELTDEDYRRLIGMHLSGSNDVTVLCCEGGGHEAYSIERDMQDEVVAVGQGEGERALHAAVFRAEVLKRALDDDKQGLYSLINEAANYDATLGVCRVPSVTEVVTGIDAYEVQKKLMLDINLGHIARGVQIFAPEQTYIAADAEIGAGTIILPGTLIRPGCKVGEGASIGPNTILEQAEIGAGTSVNSSQVYESRIGKNAAVGPFAYVRPGCSVGDNTRIGDFVELKKANIGNGTKVSHLTYIGDAEVGERVNFGCGTVVVNYDGYNKYKTVIGDDCFIGCNTNLVSPVALEDRVFTAAGTTVTENVPAGALAVGRARQKNLAGWNDRRREKYGKKK